MKEAKYKSCCCSYTGAAKDQPFFDAFYVDREEPEDHIGSDHSFGCLYHLLCNIKFIISRHSHGSANCQHIPDHDRPVTKIYYKGFRKRKDQQGNGHDRHRYPCGSCNTGKYKVQYISPAYIQSRHKNGNIFQISRYILK